MGRSEIIELANGIAEWVDRQCDLGFEKLLSEAALAIPIAKLLTIKGWVKFKGEYDLKSLFDDFVEDEQNPHRKGEINFDISAHRSGGNLLMELKYVKTINKQRLLKDLIKLALPRHKSTRLLVIVATKSISPQDGMLGEVAGQTENRFTFSRINGNCEMLWSGSRQPIDQSQYGSLFKALVNDQALHGCAVNLMTNPTDAQRRDKHKVIIWEISRQDLVPAA